MRITCQSVLMVAVCLTATASVHAELHHVAVGDGGNVFVPDDITIQLGDTVRWTWVGGLHDTTSAAGQAESWASITTSTVGHTFDHTFTNVGDFGYYCSIHGFDAGGGAGGGMAGVVRVQPNTVPAASVWAVAALSLLVLSAATVALRRRRRSPAVAAS